MIRARLLLLLLLGPLLAGCVWPHDGGGGGMAEAKAPRPLKRDIATPLHLRLACEVDRADALQESLLARGSLTGRIGTANDLAILAQREFYGGLFGDAARTLDRLQYEIASIGPLLPPGVQLPRECPPP